LFISFHIRLIYLLALSTLKTVLYSSPIWRF